MTAIETFDFNGNELSTFVDDKGRDWFRGSQVCKILDISNPATVIKREADEYWQELQIGVGRPALYVSEPGLYALIFASKTPAAKKFQKWVFEEVLPKLRVSGNYSIPQPTNDIEDIRSMQIPPVTAETLDECFLAIEYLRDHLEAVEPIAKALRNKLTAYMVTNHIDRHQLPCGLTALLKTKKSYRLLSGYTLDDIDQDCVKKALDSKALEVFLDKNYVIEGVEQNITKYFQVSRKEAWLTMHNQKRVLSNVS